MIQYATPGSIFEVEVSAYRYSEYKHVRTELATSQDLNRVQDYIAKHKPIEEFYRYQFSIENKAIVCFCLSPDLVQQLRDLKK